MPASRLPAAVEQRPEPAPGRSPFLPCENCSGAMKCMSRRLHHATTTDARPDVVNPASAVRPRMPGYPLIRLPADEDTARVVYVKPASLPRRQSRCEPRVPSERLVQQPLTHHEYPTPSLSITRSPLTVLTPKHRCHALKPPLRYVSEFCPALISIPGNGASECSMARSVHPTFGQAQVRCISLQVGRRRSAKGTRQAEMLEDRVLQDGQE